VATVQVSFAIAFPGSSHSTSDRRLVAAPGPPGGKIGTSGVEDIVGTVGVVVAVEVEEGTKLVMDTVSMTSVIAIVF
jgi:hypothetical protein